MGIQQHQLEEQSYIKEQKTRELAEDLLNGEEYGRGSLKFSINDVVEHVVEDESFMDLIKKLAQARNNQFEQAQILKDFNHLVNEQAFYVADMMEA
ncbi:hypothetical protein [Zooshikella sp. RANM57]|uniref:hypothetical protein n=1 Tax=Zooshikella sp. RANM57 TaxID=3425863 RepID=UPI003D6EAF25